MDKVLIDANVLLRYLLDDNEDMALTAEHIIDGGAWTTPECIAEVTYVLEKYYGLSRHDISWALGIIDIKVEIRPRDIAGRAIKEYEETNLDFVDCMLVAYAAAGNERVYTFDKGIRKRISALRHPETNGESVKENI